MYRYHLLVLTLFVFTLSGCVSYEAKPLTPQEIIREVEVSRQQLLLAPEETFTFTVAATRMSEHSPLLAQLKAEYATVAAVADITTPWSNPSIEATLYKFRIFGTHRWAIGAARRSKCSICPRRVS